MKMYIRGYHWPHILFFSASPIISIVSVSWLVAHGGPHWATWILAVVLLFATGMGTTAGYHRLFSHKSYQAKWAVRLLYLLFGGAAFEGSARWWACQHRIHHHHIDTGQDPYGINKGFWHAHIGWLFVQDQEPPNFDNIKDLDQDPLVRLQDRFYAPLAILIGFGLPTAIAALWGDPWGGFFVAGVTRMVFNHHATFCINSLCHYIGNRPYSDQHSARDSWIAALVTYGEGYHNFHHEFAYDYRNGIRFYQWDPTKWLINVLSWFKLAHHLRQASQEHILAARLEMDQKRAVGRLAHYSESVRYKTHEVLITTRTQLQQTFARLQKLKKEYTKVKRAQLHTFTESMGKTLEEKRLELQRAKQEFDMIMARWQQLISGPELVGGLP